MVWYWPSIRSFSVFKRATASCGQPSIFAGIFFFFMLVTLRGFMCVLLAILDNDFWSWGHPCPTLSCSTTPEYTYYLGVALLTGSGGALLDGVQVFLVQQSVGRKSIASVFRIAIGLFAARCVSLRLCWVASMCCMYFSRVGYFKRTRVCDPCIFTSRKTR